MDIKREFILNSEGKIFQREIREEEKQLSNEAINEMATSVVRHCPKAFELPDIGTVSISTDGECSYLYFTAPYLPLRAPYALKEDVIYPSFKSTSEPVFDLRWQQPKDMRLLFAATVFTVAGSIAVGDCSLLALDASQRCYRLPLGNLFEDAHICIGSYNNTGKTAAEAVTAAWNQFSTSQWQGDLDVAAEQTRSLFRFKPNKESFSQQEPLKPWVELCTKIAPPILNIIKL